MRKAGAGWFVLAQLLLFFRMGTMSATAGACPAQAVTANGAIRCTFSPYGSQPNKMKEDHHHG